MNSEHARILRLETRLAGLLHFGTWLASAMIGLGLCLEFARNNPAVPGEALLWGMWLMKAGIAVFIFLPVLRVILMLITFALERDFRFMLIAALVLVIIVLGVVVGLCTTSFPAGG